jgi:hypothetical protein
MSEFSDLNALMVPSTPAFVPTAFKALYRKSDVGIALTDTIDALIEQGKLDEAAGLEVLSFLLLLHVCAFLIIHFDVNSVFR